MAQFADFRPLLLGCALMFSGCAALPVEQIGGSQEATTGTVQEVDQATMPAPEPGSQTDPAENSAMPPPVRVLAGGQTWVMDRGSYCWVTLCADALPPDYGPADFIQVGSLLQIGFETPFPSGGMIELHRGALEGEVASSRELTLAADGALAWQLSAMPGDYILTVWAVWEGEAARDAFYTLPIRLAEADLVMTGTSTAPGGESGIEGSVLVGPMCPIEIEGQECPDRPFAATITVLDQAGQAVATIATDNTSGAFRILLAPGMYTLRPEPGPTIEYADQQVVQVQSGSFTQVVIVYDSGIR